MNVQAAQETRTRSDAKYVLFAVLGLMGLFVLWNNERVFRKPQAPEWEHDNAIRGQLLPPGLGGSIALLLCALQFPPRLRHQYIHLHRRIGKVYIAGTFVAAPVA